MSLPPALVAALSARFEWLRPLGEGANGWVGLARERALGREVALKVGKRQGDATQLGRFAREAQIAAGLKHPNAVSVHSTGVVEGHPYLVLDYVEGAQTLGDACRGAPLSSCLGYLLDVTRAMALAHSQGVVHRDLKPDNVLVDPAGVARVTDFGCASLRGADRLTQSGAAIGTPHYMPPEQFGERERVGPHSDVWSLGVMLYELGCGRRPFEGDSMTELAGQIAVGVQRCELLPDAPEGLAKVILRCLASRPGARYPHAGALLTDLEHALSSRAGAGGPPPWALGALLLTLLGACAALTLWAAGVVGDPGGVAPPATPWSSIRASREPTRSSPASRSSRHVTPWIEGRVPPGRRWPTPRSTSTWLLPSHPTRRRGSLPGRRSRCCQHASNHPKRRRLGAWPKPPWPRRSSRTRRTPTPPGSPPSSLSTGRDRRGPRRDGSFSARASSASPRLSTSTPRTPPSSPCAAGCAGH
ncbi:MAG: serine/threonine protein kinase [Planctomycetes bacterium]|nr:serine/threonine protein kinase [Planctomycetota bacterium]